jgi:hypothetical protein
LVLILTFGGSRHTPDDHMFIYDWKSGVLKMVLNRTYSREQILTPSFRSSRRPIRVMRA